MLNLKTEGDKWRGPNVIPPSGEMLNMIALMDKLDDVVTKAISEKKNCKWNCCGTVMT